MTQEATQTAPMKAEQSAFASERPRSSMTNTPIPRFKTDAFDGPLDLLLHLIRENRVDIYDIPIAQITAQYLAYVELLEEYDLAAVGEYVVLAATLIEIKSRLLLPAPPPLPGEEESEDPRAELVARLLEYERYRGTVEMFRYWEEGRRLLYFRGAAENTDDYILPVPEGEANADQLYQALRRILENAGIEEKPLTSVTPRRRLSLRLKMAEIIHQATHALPEGLAFEALFNLPCPRYDIVLTFLALLELLRLGRVRVEQAGLWLPLRIYLIVEAETGVS